MDEHREGFTQKDFDVGRVLSFKTLCPISKPNDLEGNNTDVRIRFVMLLVGPSK